MALPPEPIEHLLPLATWILDAEVEQVLAEGPPPPRPEKLAPSAPMKLRSQSVELKIRRVLRGPSEAEKLVVEKPEGSYLLASGNKGAFLLDNNVPPRILGRYGPDTHSLSYVESALARLR